MEFHSRGGGGIGLPSFPASSDLPLTLGRKCGKNRDFEPKGVDIIPPHGGHYGKGKGMGINRTQRFPSA